MTYSVIGLLAVIIHCIINVDIFRRDRNKVAAERDYRAFLLCVIAYHITDAIWGILYEHHMVSLLFLDTEVYFAAMALSVLLWTSFVLRYLGKEGAFGKLLNHIGWLLFAFQITAVVVNIFVPVLFSIDASGEYQALTARYLALGAQMLMFLMTSAYTLAMTLSTEGKVRHRHLTIGLFGLAMIFAIGAQIFYPLLPMYSIGYLLGGCVLHTFVVEDERSEYLKALEESLGREAQQQEELGETRRLAYTDSLTGVKSKHAYAEAEERMDARIAGAQVTEFALVVFDLNGLKQVNDTLGHEAGDRCIINACRLICVVFTHSPVFRIGGDEFVAILEGHDFEHRQELMDEFNQRALQDLLKDQVMVAAGISEFDSSSDTAMADVFQRADDAMYQQKRLIKEQLSIGR